MGPAESTGTASRRRPRPAVARPLLAVGILALGLGGLAGLTACSAKEGNGARATAPAGSPSAVRPGSTVGTKGGQGGRAGAPRSTVGADGTTSWNPDDLGRDHVTTPVHYPMTPPAGGDHAPVWMNCNGDVYPKPVPDVNAVHSLEHGAVWVTYTGEADPADVRRLAALVARTPYSLMSPHPGQRHPIMLTAWGRQRGVEGAGDPAVNAFFSAYVQGPQTPEPGAPCTGGLAR